MDDPLSVLKSLRWHADMKVFSPDEFGVLIWLKQIPNGLTHCCYVSNPCKHHSKIQDNINKANKN